MQTAYLADDPQTYWSNHDSRQVSEAPTRTVTLQANRKGTGQSNQHQMRLVLVESKFTPDTCDQAKLAVKVWRHKLSRERDDKLLRRAGVSKVWLDIAHEPSRETPMKICVQFEENNALLERLQALTECLFESTKGLKEVAIAVHLSIDRHNDAPPDTFRIYKAGPTP